uniref:Rhs element Vgr protein n=1 Tax=uncultured bacterium contig00045 TaxID=1181531 RepID=A0A806KI22_9BACT|nr:Rhs element Vgr protein [uncultured bacterium contig00045]
MDSDKPTPLCKNCSAGLGGPKVICPKCGYDNAKEPLALVMQIAVALATGVGTIALVLLMLGWSPWPSGGDGPAIAGTPTDTPTDAPSDAPTSNPPTQPTPTPTRPTDNTTPPTDDTTPPTGDPTPTPPTADPSTTPPTGDPTPPPKTAKVGDIIQFGGHNWLVLDVQGGKMLIVTEKLLEARRFTNSQREDMSTWERSGVRRYLNGDFYDSFSEADKARIAETLVTTADNPWSGKSGSPDTTDKIFLLSLEEVVRYFGDSGQLNNRPSSDTWAISDQYNEARMADDGSENSFDWWLRSPSCLSGASAAVVSFNGAINLQGFHASIDGCYIRPALWLDP